MTNRTSIFDYPEELREAYNSFEAFRRLGFASEEILFGTGMAPNIEKEIIYVSLQSQGKIFNVIVGLVGDRSVEEVENLWRDLCEKIVDYTISEEDLQLCFQQSKLMLNRLEFVTSLITKGFEIPKDKIKPIKNEMLN